MTDATAPEKRQGLVLFLYAEQGIHAGGAGGIGALDLPIQREVTTRLPTIWASSLKGALKSHARSEWGADDVTRVFGSDPGQESEPGWLEVGDARLVAFPAPTSHHVFTWVTSPLALARLARVARLAGASVPAPIAVGSIDEALGAPNGAWDAVPRAGIGPYGLTVRRSDDVGPWARFLADRAVPIGAIASDPFAWFRTKLTDGLVVVDDIVLADTTEECADVQARVQLNANKTVAAGPWFEEHLPADSILVTFLSWGTRAPEDGPRELAELLDGALTTIGGEVANGKGLTWLRVLHPNGAHA